MNLKIEFNDKYLNDPFKPYGSEENFRKSLPTLHFPDEIWMFIFSEIDLKDLYHFSLVNKKWNQLTNDPILSKNIIFKEFCFNPSHWNAFCGEGTVSNDDTVKAYQLLPNNINEILKSSCPAFIGKKIIDSHLLVWIPSSIKGEPVTIVNFGHLLKEQPEFSRNQMGYQYIQKTTVIQEGNKLVESGWVLMTKDLIPNSRHATDLEHNKMVDRLNKTGQTGYRIPKIAEVIICIAAIYLRDKKRLLNDWPWTLTRCQESVQGFQVLVGGFIKSGFYVSRRNSDSIEIGIAVLRKFKVNCKKF